MSRIELDELDEEDKVETKEGKEEKKDKQEEEEEEAEAEAEVDEDLEMIVAASDTSIKDPTVVFKNRTLSLSQISARIVQLRNALDRPPSPSLAPPTRLFSRIPDDVYNTWGYHFFFDRRAELGRDDAVQIMKNLLASLVALETRLEEQDITAGMRRTVISRKPDK